MLCLRRGLCLERGKHPLPLGYHRCICLCRNFLELQASQMGVGFDAVHVEDHARVVLLSHLEWLLKSQDNVVCAHWGVCLLCSVQLRNSYDYPDVAPRNLCQASHHLRTSRRRQKGKASPTKMYIKTTTWSLQRELRQSQQRGCCSCLTATCSKRSTFCLAGHGLRHDFFEESFACVSKDLFHSLSQQHCIPRNQGALGLISDDIKVNLLLLPLLLLLLLGLVRAVA
mmetsp:Transcript_16909/g.36390  ORF Transcript_16909/g.36390 Transcript_16909/m.36390 type:complete len:227 (+) Transcript_16909:1191-1871(+)